MKIKEKTMEELELFESASKDLFDNMQGFKDNLSVQFPLLDSDNWQFDKGSIKVCKADESGFKKRCRVGISYNLKVSLLNEDAEQIWLLFRDWFNTSRLSQVERNPNNEDLGRYVFSASSSLGDQVDCSIYLPNEWNIPQISFSGYLTARYRACDLVVIKTEEDYGLRYLIDNGSGDSLDVILTDKTILIKGFDHESSLSQFAADEWNQDVIDSFYKGLDEKYVSLYSEDQKDETTFFIWYDGHAHQQTYQDKEGGEWLLSYLFDSFERFHEFVTDYYEITVDKDLLRKLYMDGQLSDIEVKQLIQES